MSTEAIYRQFYDWCRSIGVEPMTYEAWLQKQEKFPLQANQYSHYVK